MRRPGLLLGAALALLAALPAPARASSNQESMFQDDNRLVYGTPEVVASTLDTLRALGVDRIRVSVFWRIVAPGGDSKQRPSFDAADPAGYPQDKWDRYDALVEAAQSRGIGVDFNVTSPAPLWATGSPDRADIEETYNPSAADFGKFVQALGTRYSGTYAPAGASGPLPRVDYWSIWNEPNQAGWLTPQWAPDPTGGGKLVEAAPAIYRGLVDAAFGALLGTGHGQDTILVGEIAPKGLNVQGETRSIKALQFLRDLYCVDRHYRVLTGAAAASLGCPGGAPRDFAVAHPGLFSATGFAEHPYSLLQPPSAVSRDPDFVTIADLPRLTRALERIFRRYRQSRPDGVPLYLTEFGYQTNPPDPLGYSLRRQASFLNQGEFIAYANPEVRALSQFLLVDDAPEPGLAPKDPNYWGTFQTGLVDLQGNPKPAFDAYRIPIFLPRTTQATRRFRIWALLRPGPGGARLRAQVQFRRRGAKGAFSTILIVPTNNPRGYLDRGVNLPGTGLVRIAWTDATTGQTITSRVVSVRVRPGATRSARRRR